MTFKYEIKINEQGRPYIFLPPEFQNNNEDVFMALEISRYYFDDLINRALKKEEESGKVIFTEEEKIEIGKVGFALEKYADQYAYIILKQMEAMNELGSVLEQQRYDIAVDSIEDRDNIKTTAFVIDDRFFERKIGFRVLIKSTGEVFELQGGIDNDNWVKI